MIVLDPNEDRFHNLEAPGSYEWTYFDGLSNDGQHGFTAIWFRGIPMSPYYSAAIDGARDAAPERYCAFAFGLYHRGRRIASGLEEGPEHLFFGDTGSPDASFRENSVHSARDANGATAFHIGLNIRRPMLAGRVAGTIDLQFPPTDLNGAGTSLGEAPGKHWWVPAGPGGTFTAAIDILRPGRQSMKHRFEGTAYHDRNLGTEPLQRLDVDWSWGRVHFDSRAFVFFGVRPRPGAEGHHDPDSESHRLFLFDNGRLLDSVDSYTPMKFPQRSHWATLPYPEGFGSNEEASGLLGFSARNESLLDSGPFYHRMVARFNVRHGDAGLNGIGITEYLRPARLGIAAFRPFVKFRVRRVS